MIDTRHISGVFFRVLRVPLHLVEDRRRRLADYLQQHAYAPLRDLCAQFEISEATVRRDLAALVAQKQIVRTYGGALTEYNQRFPSFRDRARLRPRAKRRIAAAARALILPGTSCFLDFGTTIFAIAEALQRRPVADLRIITNSLPIAELLTPSDGMRVFLLGGESLPRQSVLLGGPARRAVRFHTIDQAFMGAEAADARGVWNSQDELVSLQQTVIAHASRNVLCLDSSKLRHKAPSFLAPWSKFDLFITDSTPALLKGLGCGQRQLV